MRMRASWLAARGSLACGGGGGSGRQRLGVDVRQQRSSSTSVLRSSTSQPRSRTASQYFLAVLALLSSVLYITPWRLECCFSAALVRAADVKENQGARTAARAATFL